jgi:hypothetical protein
MTRSRPDRHRHEPAAHPPTRSPAGPLTTVRLPVHRTVRCAATAATAVLLALGGAGCGEAARAPEAHVVPSDQGPPAPPR